MEGFKDLQNTVWLNKEFLNWQDAKAPIVSHGFQYGGAVFEGIRAYNKKIFRAEEHFKRLHRSAEILDFIIPYSVEEMIQATQELIKKNNLEDCYIRPFAYRGSEEIGIFGKNCKANVLIAMWQWNIRLSKEKRNKGLKLDISRYKRPAPDTSPYESKASGLYAICTIAKHEAIAKNMDDALMLDYRGLVAEATGANIFFIDKNDAFHTPEPDCFLNGITRQEVIKLLTKKNFTCNVRHIKLEELKNFNQCFIVGTAAEIVPVSSIGNYQFNTGTNLLETIFQDYVDLVTP